MGETILGQGFALGPGGKGSNQAVAAARLGAEVHFVSRLGDDAFADMALETWDGGRGAAGGGPRTASSYTGAAFIFVDAASGDNAIIISPGAAARIAPADLEAQAALIRGGGGVHDPARAAARRGGARARDRAGGRRDHDPEPGAGARRCPTRCSALCDWVTPNETEAAALTGLPVEGVAAARAAADLLVARGAGGGGHHPRGAGGAAACARRLGAGAGDRGRAGGRDDRGRRRLQRRLRRRARPRHGAGRRGAPRRARSPASR